MRHSSCPLPVHEYAASDNLAEQSGGVSASHSTIEPRDEGLPGGRPFFHQDQVYFDDKEAVVPVERVCNT